MSSLVGTGDGVNRPGALTRPARAAKEEVLAFSALPRAQWRQLWSTNPLERLNKELRRRCKVVGIFPAEPALIRLAGAVPLDTHEEWIAAERRCFSEGSIAKLHPERDDVDAAIGELEGADAG